MKRIDEYVLSAQRTNDADFVQRYPYPVLLLRADEDLVKDDWSFKTQTIPGPRLGLLNLSPAEIQRAKELERFGVYPVVKAEGSPWRERISIGRARNNDIVILDNSVSKLHAHFAPHDDGSISLADAGSRNGTKTNEVLLKVGQSAPMVSGDTLTLGRLNMVFYQANDFYAFIMGKFRKS